MYASLILNPMERMELNGTSLWCNLSYSIKVRLVSKQDVLCMWFLHYQACVLLLLRETNNPTALTKDRRHLKTFFQFFQLCVNLPFKPS